MGFVLGIRLGVAFGKLGDFRQGLRAILPHKEVAAIWERRKERRVLRVDAITETFELQLAHDFFLHEARKVRGRGNAIPGPDLLGDGASAHQFTAFENQHAAARARQIGGRDQAVVSRADD